MNALLFLGYDVECAIDDDRSPLVVTSSSSLFFLCSSCLSCYTIAQHSVASLGSYVVRLWSVVREQSAILVPWTRMPVGAATGTFEVVDP